MLNMRIERAPLKESENRAILEEYNRLTGAGIPLEEFVHWVKDSPAGSAWHAILETDEGRIVGHTSVFPLRTTFRSRKITPAKSEFSVLHENFRKEKIRGQENGGKSAFIFLLDYLFRHCQEQGWGPIFASTNEKNQVFTRKVGLRPLEFPLWECLLILQPGRAARLTPNVNDWQRAGIFSAGLLQRIAWSVAPRFLSSSGIGETSIEKNGFPLERERLAFFQDSDSLRWRYLKGQYIRFEIGDSPAEYLIAKRGSPTKFLRVCQWRLEKTQRLSGLLSTLVRQARRDSALGVRWAVYDGEASAERIVGKLRRAGFLTARRTRIVMVHNKEEEYLNTSLWKMNDSLFSFDP
jgi:hypothetical protein